MIDMARKTVASATCILTRLRTRSFVGLIGIALTLTAAPAARATLLVDDGQCGGTGGEGQCYATNGTVGAVAFQPVELTPGEGTGWANFVSAFNSWNASPSGGNDFWTLDTGTLSAEATLTVSTYRAFVQTGSCDGDPMCGGAEIQVNYNNGGNAPNPISGCTLIAGNPNCESVPDGAAIWSQSILTDQKRNPSQPGNPYIDNAPDTADASIGPPAYPFQYNDSFFYDMPSRDAQATWLADAWISSIDTTTDTLTVYDGVEWGFEVPEPSSIALLMAGLAAFAIVRRRRTG